jgi:hypothetical protein
MNTPEGLTQGTLLSGLTKEARKVNDESLKIKVKGLIGSQRLTQSNGDGCCFHLHLFYLLIF